MTDSTSDPVGQLLRDKAGQVAALVAPPDWRSIVTRQRPKGVAYLRRGRGWPGWIAPLAAAAAVTAVVAASLAISAVFGHARPAGTGPAPAAPSHGSPAGGKGLLRLAPPYFAELWRTAPVVWGGEAVVVRSTLTGRVLATVAPPPPYRIFTWVSAAADDRTFVLAAQRYWPIASGNAGLPAQNRDNSAPTVFFRLIFHPRTRAAQLTRLAVPGVIHASNLAGMGVSPDGTRLALDFRQSIEIVTLATGTTRTWTWPDGGWVGNFKPFGQIFSWSSNGRYLAFQQWDGGDPETMHVRVLDTTAPGTSLTTAKVILTLPGSLANGDTLLTPDGTKVVAETSPGGYIPGSSNSSVQITEYSARTGRPLFAEDRFSAPTDWQDVLWTDQGGNALVVADPRGANPVMGVLAGNKFTPIPHGAVGLVLYVAW